ncbi:MAG: hypothetical protein NVSMB9_12650 [Isosphaeraceae bacterium]
MFGYKKKGKTMTWKHSWAWMTVAALLSMGAVDDKEDGDLKKLEGKWTTASGTGGKVSYTFEGNKLKVVAPSRTYEISITIDSQAKPEKTIDFKIDEAPDDAKGKTSKGIYKFDGDDTLIWCFRPEGDRPSKYEMVGFEQILSELKREKK